MAPRREQDRATYKKYEACRRREWKEWCWSWKRSWGCISCSDKNPDHLLFHHIEPAIKSYTFGDMGQNRDSTQLAELVKCVVLCRDCHYIVHSLERLESRKKVMEAKYYG